MSKDVMKINCVLEGDSVIDFERLSMVLKVGQYKETRQKQQAAIIGAALLILDASKQKYTLETGKRYPTLVELLEYAGIARPDINELLGIVEPPSDASIASLAAAISGGEKE